MFWTIFVIGEKIDGPANVRDSINGKVLFVLEDNIEVESEEIQNGWYFIGLEVRLPSNWDKWYFPKGYELYDEEGNHLGKSLQDIELYTRRIGKDCELTVLKGFTFKSNIRPLSIVEKQLEKIIIDNEELVLNTFKSHIANNNYRSDSQFQWIETYILYETWLEDPSPGDRIRLIFENNMLIGIIHTRAINSKNHKSIQILGDWKLMSFLEPKDAKNKKLITQYRSFLNSVD